MSLLTWLKRSKISFCFSLTMPMPVSLTLKAISKSEFSALTTSALNFTLPFSVNLMAFPTRLMRI
jgi:hypothetical protein